MKFFEDWYAPHVYGALTALVVVIFLVVLTNGYTTYTTNQAHHEKRIVISEKLCFDSILGSNVSKVKDTEGNIYFIDSDLCQKATVGYYHKISYTHTHQLFSDKIFDFETIDGIVPTGEVT